MEGIKVSFIKNIDHNSVLLQMKEKLDLYPTEIPGFCEKKKYKNLKKNIAKILLNLIYMII